MINNKIIWIIGASSGIGKALTLSLINLGAKLIISSRNHQELLKLKNSSSDNSKIEVLPFDVSDDPKVLVENAEYALQKFGVIDIVIYCSGVSQRSLTIDTDIAVYHRLMNVNFFGVVSLTKTILPFFLKRNAGKFVVINSVSGLAGAPFRSGYCASKHALDGFFSSVKTEIWDSNVKILMVYPGPVKTNISANALLGDGQLFNVTDELIKNGMDVESCAVNIINAIKDDREYLLIGVSKENLQLIRSNVLSKFK